MERIKRIVRWMEIALLALVIVALGVNQWFVWMTGSRLERQLAAIRSAGDPTSLADLVRKPIAPERNAAAYLWRAKADALAMSRDVFRMRGVVRDFGSLPFPIPAPFLMSMKKIVDAHPNTIPLLEKAAACPDYSRPLDVTQPADEFFLSSAAVTDTYSMYNQVLLCVRAMPLIGEDKRDEGMKTVISALQLARHFDRNPLVISYRGSVDIRASAIEVANLAMQTGPVSQETRDALDAELAVQDRLEAYTWAVSTQRALFMDEFRSIRGNNVWFIARAYWNQQQSDCLDALQFHLELSRDTAPYRQVKQKIDDSPTQAWGQGSSTLPDIELAQRAVTRFRAKVRALRLINALQSHVSSDNQGPVDLAELGLPAEATTDPFTGEPMHVRKLADGWLVYAVGENFRDDGGNLRQNRDIGIGPPDRPGRFADL